LANAIDVFSDDRIIDQFGRAFHFLGELFAETDFAFDGIEINAFADAAIADRVDILLGVLGFDGVRRSDRNIGAGIAFLLGFRGRGRRAVVEQAAARARRWDPAQRIAGAAVLTNPVDCASAIPEQVARQAARLKALQK